MNARMCSALGIGYYYRMEDGSVVYIPISRGKSVIEPWLRKENREFWKVGLVWDASTIKTSTLEG